MTEEEIKKFAHEVYNGLKEEGGTECQEETGQDHPRELQAHVMVEEEDREGGLAKGLDQELVAGKEGVSRTSPARAG